MWIKLQMNDGTNKYIMDVRYIEECFDKIKIYADNEVYTIEKPQDEPIRIDNVKNMECETI